MNGNLLPATIEIAMSVSWTSQQIEDVAAATTPIGTNDEARDSERIPICCPVNLAHILRRAGAIWEPGSKRWLVQRRRIGPVIRALEKATDPLFRQAGMALD